MRILAVGDIVGNSGVNKLKEELQNIKNEFSIDFVIVNGENAAEGMGLTIKNYNDIISAGADCITMGNHTWGKKEIFQIIDEPKLLRPINYPEGVCGKGFNIFECNGKKDSLNPCTSECMGFLSGKEVTQMAKGKGVSGNTHSRQQLNNYANQNNRNNQANRANNNNHSNQLNPNNFNYKGNK